MFNRYYSSEQLIYFSKEIFKEQNIYNNKYISLTNQDGEEIKGYNKKTDIVIIGNEYRKSLSLENINSIMVQTNNKKKLHSLGLSHLIKEDNSIVHSLYNSHLISQRQFSILYSYPDWGTLSFGAEGTLVTDMKNLQRKCKAINNTFWGCHLSGIYIEKVDLPLEDEKIKRNNINIEIGQDTIFDNGASDVIVPKEIFDFFYNIISKNLFLSKINAKFMKIIFIKKLYVMD